MDRIKIQGVAGFDGEYEVDQSAFNMGDLRLIKRVSGVRAAELEEALSAGDVEVLVAIAMIALRRTGHPHWAAFNEAVNEATLDPSPLEFIPEEEESDEPDPQRPPREPES